MDALPSEFEARVHALFNEDAPRVLESLATQAPDRQKTFSIRLNSLRDDCETTRRALADAGLDLHTVNWCSQALVVRNSTVRDVQATEPHGRGAFYIQSLSSIAAGLVLAPEPGEHVLDLCAAPGSKTSHLAAMMQNTGRLVANDLSRARTYRLRDVLSRLGAEAEVVTGRGEQYGRRHRDIFDRVLVDAPCSAEGRSSDSRADWSIKKIKRLASLQKSLLHAAIDATKPGGVVVYSTCTFAPEENEMVLARALYRYANAIELEPLPLDLPQGAWRPPVSSWNGRAIDADLSHARRLIPGPESGFEGFFIARLRKLRTPLNR